MKQFFNFALILSAVIVATIPQVSLAKSIEENIKDTGVLKVGVRTDSPLFGYGEKYDGYCTDFAKEFAAKLSKDYGKTLKIELLSSTTQNRWNLVNKGDVHFECGPNTITKEREQRSNIVFSSPFFYTATQIFTKDGINDQALKDGTIGVIANTTNEAEIETIYNPEKLKNFYVKRTHGIGDVIMGDLTGFASDGILLMGTAFALGIDVNKYTLMTPQVNKRPFCSAYGMILPAGTENQKWRDTVNGFILSNQQSSQTWNKWFADSVPYIGAVLKACEAK